MCSQIYKSVKASKGRSLRQKAPAGTYYSHNLSCPSFPFKFDDLAVLELFREESTLTLPAPAVQSSAQSVPYSWLYYNNNVTAVHLHLLQRSLTIPQRDIALKEESARGIMNERLWVTVQKGKMTPVRPPDRFYSQRKGKKTRAGGMGHQKKKKKKSKRAWQTCMFMWRENREGEKKWNKDNRTFNVKSQQRHDSTCLATQTLCYRGRGKFGRRLRTEKNELQFYRGRMQYSRQFLVM